MPLITRKGEQLMEPLVDHSEIREGKYGDIRTKRGDKCHIHAANDIGR